MKTVKSRTIWTLVMVAILGAVQALQPFLDPSLYTVVNALLLATAGYFKLNPSQEY